MQVGVPYLEEKLVEEVRGVV